MTRRPLTVPTSGTQANAEDYGDTPTPLAVWVTPDGVVVGGPGAWRQLSSLIPAAYAANWAVADWYLDGVVGNDANNGTTAATPLRTGAELARRLGAYALWGQSVTVHVLANGMTDALILQGCMLVAGTHLDVIGTPTVLASDVVGSYAALTHATPIATQLTGTAIVDWTPYQWRRLRNTNPARLDNIVWIATANPAGAGVATARVTVPGALNLASNTSIFTSGTAWVFGDSFVVESLPAVPQITIVVDGPLLQTVGPQYDRRQILLRDIECPIVISMPASRVGVNKTVIFGNRLSQWTCGLAPTTSNAFATIYSSHIFEPDTANVQMRLFNSTSNCLYGMGFTSVAVVSTLAISNALFQGVTFNSGTLQTVITGTQIFDTAVVNNAAANLKNSSVSSLSGSGNAGYGLGLTNSNLLTLTGTINLLGAVSNGRWLSTPGVSLTLPQLLQPNDYAQKGTATIGASGAGFADVVVPYWDPTIQRLTVTPKDLLGTPGTISCPSANRTNTGFRIQSSNVLDVSTVDWQISAIGRNIFVSTS